MSGNVSLIKIFKALLFIVLALVGAAFMLAYYPAANKIKGCCQERGDRIMESTKVVFRGRAYGEVQLFSDDIKAGEMNIAITSRKKNNDA